MRYFVRNAEGQELVVPSLADLHALYDQGFLADEDLVRAETADRWIRAGAMPALHGAKKLFVGWGGSCGLFADGSAQCVNCHTNAFCDGCHGMPMPHPSGWLRAHTAQTKGFDGPRCVRCHLSEDCKTCHTAHTHPGRVRGP